MSDILDLSRWKYLLRCASSYLTGHAIACPYCGSSASRVVQRRYIVSALRCCTNCKLRFRTPTETTDFNAKFYENEYQSGATTDLPSPTKLAGLIESGFAGSDKDFAHRIAVLQALGVEPGARVLDFGASWGYATWQLRRAGYDAFGLEVSRSRARFGRDNLGVPIYDDPRLVPAGVDVVFSSHVLEHLPTPRYAFQLADRVTRPGGLFVAFVPNGGEQHLQRDPDSYHQLWSRLHPLYIDADFCRHLFPHRPKLFASARYDKPYRHDLLASWDRVQDLVLALDESELLLALVM